MYGKSNRKFLEMDLVDSPVGHPVENPLLVWKLQPTGKNYKLINEGSKPMEKS